MFRSWFKHFVKSLFFIILSMVLILPLIGIIGLIDKYITEPYSFIVIVIVLAIVCAAVLALNETFLGLDKENISDV